MNTVILLSNLVFAHLLGDFFLQPQWMLKGKRDRQFGSLSLYVHAAIMGLLSWTVVFRVEFWPYALGLGVSHIIFDGIKNGNFRIRFWPFVIDQIAHLLVIVSVALWYAAGNVWSQFPFVPKGYAIVAPLGVSIVIFLTRPVNIFIHELFEWNRTRAKQNAESVKRCAIFDFSIDETDKEKRMPNASSWIGAFERVLAFVFVFLGNYQAVGFIMAAKSILRFKESDGPRAEYVLVGTFVSVTIAVLCALLLKMLVGLAET